jgi:choline-sulfatase
MASFQNILILMSDEHSNKVLGCHGHPFVLTPNLDLLASRGTRFANACTNSPICVPARASFATGRYVFETACWDNSSPYTGSLPSWGHALGEKGIPSFSVGKLHYRNESDDTGFTEQIMPMHVLDGIGDVLGAVRDPLPVRVKSKAIATEIGPGESAYTEYDRKITNAACDWLARRGATSPWVLFVGWVAPHFPLIAPPEFYHLYQAADLPLPKASAPEHWPRHPWIDRLRECFITDRFFTDETRRVALAAYYGLVSYLDHNVGRVLAALEASGAARDTLVLYTSDHGENLGARGLWGKYNMYEEATAVPLIVSGGDVACGRTSRTPVSLIDVYPTLLHAFGHRAAPEAKGTSLLHLARATDDARRTVFAEYHAAGAATGAFMLRNGRHKYVHYVGMPPQLFDLASDPEELNDLAGERAYAQTLEGFASQLGGICDAAAVDRRAKADQAALVVRHGGRDKVVARGSFGFTPTAGMVPAFS